MNPLFMAFMRAASLALNDASKKMAEDNSLRNHQYKRSENDYYKPAPETNKEVVSITRQRAEEIGFQVCKIKDIDGSPCYMITKYNKCEFVVRFPEKIDNLPVRVIGSEVFENNGTDNSPAKWVEEVWIPKTVRLIKDRAFADCVNLKEVHFSGNTPEMFPDSFHNCHKLKSPSATGRKIIKQPQYFEISRRKDSDGRECNGITRYKGYDTVVHFPEMINGFPVRIIHYGVFQRKNPDTDKWESHWVKEVYIPKTVVLIQDFAFRDCKELEKIHFEGDIPEIQPDAFWGCDKLKNPPMLQERITEPWLKPETYDTQSPTRFETEKIFGKNAVRINKILGHQAEVIIPEKINGLSVVEIKGGVPDDYDERRRNFGNYTLKKISFPDSVEKIGRMAFMKCWGLESVRLPNNPNLELCEDSFWGCEKLRLADVTFPDGKDYSDYIDIFGCCNAMQTDYDRKMRLEHEQVKTIQQVQERVCTPEYEIHEDTDKFVVISEKYNNIYRALSESENVVIDDCEEVVTDDYWKTRFKFVRTGNLIFKNGGNTAVIPITIRYKSGWGFNDFATERRDLYIKCIENTSADGKFFDMELYDENILKLLPSMKRKLDVCYYRLSSGYRLSAKHMRAYESFVREHAKKAVYCAIDSHDKARLEWCIKWELMNDRNYNAVLEYARRKGASDMFEGMEKSGNNESQTVWGALKCHLETDRNGKEKFFNLSVSRVYQRVTKPDGRDVLIYKEYEQACPYKGFVPLEKPKLVFGQLVYSKNDNRFAHISDIYWNNSANKMYFKLTFNDKDISDKRYYYGNLKAVGDISPTKRKNDNSHVFSFYGFNDWRDFSVVTEVIRQYFSPDEINIDCIRTMSGYFVRDGIHIGVCCADDNNPELFVRDDIMQTDAEKAVRLINDIWHKCVDIILERQK